MLKQILIHRGRQTVILAVPIAVAYALTFSIGISDARDKSPVPAPLGLEWGWNQTDLIRNGVEIKSNKPSKSGAARILTITNTPEEIMGTNLVTISLTDRYGLQKVSWASTIFREDIIGSRGKARYSELKSALTQKYGPPKSYERISKSKEFSGQSNQFYQCMRIKGCGAWASYWTTNFVGSIKLEIKGLKSGNGYISLSYEGPKFTQWINDQKRLKEKGAL